MEKLFIYLKKFKLELDMPSPSTAAEEELPPCRRDGIVLHHVYSTSRGNDLPIQGWWAAPCAFAEFERWLFLEFNRFDFQSVARYVDLHLPPPFFVARSPSSNCLANLLKEEKECQPWIQWNPSKPLSPL